MYSNMNPSLRWKKAFIKLCTKNKIKYIHSKIDPCILHKRDEEEKLSLIMVMYVDNVLISGKEKDIKELKERFKKTYKITNLGKLKRHLVISW